MPVGCTCNGGTPLWSMGNCITFSWFMCAWITCSSLHALTLHPWLTHHHLCYVNCFYAGLLWFNIYVSIICVVQLKCDEILFPSCLQCTAFICYFWLWGTLLAFLIYVCMWCFAYCFPFSLFSSVPTIVVLWVPVDFCFIKIFLVMLNSLNKINWKEKNIVTLISHLLPNGGILLNVYV